MVNLFSSHYCRGIICWAGYPLKSLQLHPPRRDVLLTVIGGHKLARRPFVVLDLSVAYLFPCVSIYLLYTSPSAQKHTRIHTHTHSVCMCVTSHAPHAHARHNSTRAELGWVELSIRDDSKRQTNETKPSSLPPPLYSRRYRCAALSRGPTIPVTF